MSQIVSTFSQANINENDSKFKSRFDCEFLDEGGNGEVFEATDKTNGLKYAIKKINLKESENVEREKKIKDCDHPNIVKYIDSWEEGEYLYIQMELCDKENLAVWLLKNDKSVREAKFLPIYKQIISGVKYLHSKGFIHRDLKPENIFFGPDGLIKLGDFGTLIEHIDQKTPCAANTNARTMHTADIGTPPYVAPEMSDGNYGQKVDIFSLGVIFFELLTPFPNNRERYECIDLLLQNKEFPNDPRLENQFTLIKKMLSEIPEERPSIDEVARCVNSWDSEGIVLLSVLFLAVAGISLAIFTSTNFNQLQDSKRKKANYPNRKEKILPRKGRPSKMRKNHRMLQ